MSGFIPNKDLILKKSEIIKWGFPCFRIRFVFSCGENNTISSVSIIFNFLKS